MPVIEMTELIPLLGAELGDMRKEPKSQVLWADVAQKIRVQHHIFGPQAADQHMLTAANRLVQFAQAKIALARHRRGYHRTMLIAQRKIITHTMLVMKRDPSTRNSGAPPPYGTK